MNNNNPELNEFSGCEHIFQFYAVPDFGVGRGPRGETKLERGTYAPVDESGRPYRDRGGRWYYFDTKRRLIRRIKDKVSVARLEKQMEEENKRG